MSLCPLVETDSRGQITSNVQKFEPASRDKEAFAVVFRYLCILHVNQQFSEFAFYQIEVVGRRFES